MGSIHLFMKLECMDLFRFCWCAVQYCCFFNVFGKKKILPMKFMLIKINIVEQLVNKYAKITPPHTSDKWRIEIVIYGQQSGSAQHLFEHTDVLHAHDNGTQYSQNHFAFSFACDSKLCTLFLPIIVAWSIQFARLVLMVNMEFMSWAQ